MSPLKLTCRRGLGAAPTWGGSEGCGSCRAPRGLDESRADTQSALPFAMFLCPPLSDALPTHRLSWGPQSGGCVYLPPEHDEPASGPTGSWCSDRQDSAESLRTQVCEAHGSAVTGPCPLDIFWLRFYGNFLETGNNYKEIKLNA